MSNPIPPASPAQAPTPEPTLEIPPPPEDEPDAGASTAAAPTLWRPEYVRFAQQLCEQGATDQEVADVLRISRRTLYYWLVKHPELRDAMRLGKDAPDDRVERAYYQRAVGYDIDVEKCFQYQGAPVKVRSREHIPADPGAAHNWLCNRRPDKWRKRQELTGPDGGPIELKSTIEFVDAAGEPGAVSE